MNQGRATWNGLALDLAEEGLLLFDLRPFTVFACFKWTMGRNAPPKCVKFSQSN
jgi:hypothetical protein